MQPLLTLLSSLDYDTLHRLTTECKSLRELVQTLQDANSKLEEEPSLASPAGSKLRPLILSQPASQVSSAQVGPAGELERSLEEAEEKISGLLQVKEKLVNVQVISGPAVPGNISLPITKYFPQAEKERLEGDVTRLEEELSIIAVASRTLTACTVIPIIGQSTEYNAMQCNAIQYVTIQILAVLLIAIVMAFLPWISSIFGTRDF